MPIATLRRTCFFVAMALSLVTPAFAAGAANDPLFNPDSLGNRIFVTGGVAGHAGANADTLDSRTITADEAMWSPAYYHLSDARLKTNVHPIDNALDKVLKMRGVEFNWKKDGHADIGLVAQDVAMTFPGAVMKDDKGMMAVEYDSLVGPMIEAIRELKSQNDDLRKQVAGMDEMKAQLERISATVLDLKRQNAQLRSPRFEGGEGHGTAKPSADAETP